MIYLVYTFFNYHSLQHSTRNDKFVVLWLKKDCNLLFEVFLVLVRDVVVYSLLNLKLIILYWFSDTRQDEDEQSGSRGDRITTTSLIKFRPTSADNDITWACEAEHPALLNPPLRTAVLLSVQRKLVINLFSWNKIPLCNIIYYSKSIIHTLGYLM